MKVGQVWLWMGPTLCIKTTRPLGAIANAQNESHPQEGVKAKLPSFNHILKGKVGNVVNMQLCSSFVAAQKWTAARSTAALPSAGNGATRSVTCMAKKKGVRLIVTLECTEARAEGGTPSRCVCICDCGSVIVCQGCDGTHTCMDTGDMWLRN